MEKIETGAAKASAEMKAQMGKMEAQLKQWGAKIDELVGKADGVRAEAKADYRKSIDELKAKQHAAKSKLDEMRTAGHDKWQGFKTGLDSALTELEGAFKKLTKN